MKIQDKNQSKSLFVLSESPWTYWIPKFVGRINDSQVFYATYGFKKYPNIHSFPFDSEARDVVDWIIRNKFRRVVLITNQAGLTRDYLIGKMLLNHKISVVFQSRKATLIGLSKIRQKEILSKNNFPTPKFEIVDNLATAYKKARQLGFPLIFKVSCLSDGRKMQFIQREEEIEDYYYENAINEPVIIEKYIEGKELSTIIYYNFGKPLVFPIISKPTTSYLYDNKNVRKRVYYSPDKELIKIEKQVQNMALQLSKKIDNRYLMGLDMILDKNGSINIIEINAREIETLRMSMMLTNTNIYEAMHSMKVLEKNVYLEPNGFVVDVPVSLNIGELDAKLKQKNIKSMTTTTRTTLHGRGLSDLLQIVGEIHY